MREKFLHQNMMEFIRAKSLLVRVKTITMQVGTNFEVGTEMTTNNTMTPLHNHIMVMDVKLEST